MFAYLAEYVYPLGKKELPSWFYQFSRLSLAIFFLFLPMLYKGAVPEVGADFKWVTAHWVSLLFSALLFVSWFKHTPAITLKFPVTVWAMIVFTICLVLSAIDPYNPYKAWWFLKHWVSYSLLFFLVYYLRNENWYKAILAVLIVPFTFNSTIGILQFFVIQDADIAKVFPLWEGVSFVDWFRQSAPPGATLANKNLAASYTVLMLPITLYAIFAWKHKIPQTLATISFTLGSIFLVYTRSRGSWVAAMAAAIFLVLWLVCIPQNRALIKSVFCRYRVLLLVGSLVITVIASQAESNLSKRYHSVTNTVSDQFSSIGRMDEGDIGTRVAYWLNSMKIIADHPFNGIGLSNFQTIYPLYHKAIYKTPKIGYAVEARPQRTHNDFIEAFVETGIIGGISFATLFIYTLCMGWKFARSSASPSMRLASIFILTSVGGIGVNAMGDFPFQMPTAPIVTWALIAILTGLYVLHFKEEALIGFNKTVKAPAAVYAVIAALLFVTLYYVVEDDRKRMKAAVIMKYVMSYSAAGIFNDTVLDKLEQAHKIYPYNSRTMEYRGTIPVNYTGKRVLSLDTLMQMCEEAIKYDPYAPNNLINLGGVYFRKAMQADKLKDGEVAGKYAEKMLEIYDRLMPLAYFSPHTYSLAGYAHLLQEEPNKAIAFFDKAVKLDRSYSSALTGQMLTIKALQMEGYSDHDIQVMRGKRAVTPALPSAAIEELKNAKPSK
jgi:O-antigen ligase